MAPWSGDGKIKTHDINTQFTWVSDLIDDNSRTWKPDMFVSWFDIEDMDQICCIPIARLELQDKIFLRYDQSGEYLVKSGYKVMRNEFSGVIGRDRTGEIMASCVVPHNNVLDALMVESLACLQVIYYAKELRFKRIIIEGDSLIYQEAKRRDANNAAHVLTRDHRTQHDPCF
ncbi:hypothetical protein V6N11_026821 [Hibiscus sabdariffa]|uniref:RNase H type-1 domain-containing protein n=1 Tax=Hibiscus sabdariffa TaxID=183260 RepID=A0ABR2SX47_9ROSI